MNEARSAMHIGTVKYLYRYPVKSLLGEQCVRLDVDQRGVANDRLYAINNSEGKFGSHKNTRRFRKMNGLFELRATVRDGITWIVFPDGHQLACDDPEMNSRLSEVIGQPVTLKPEATISHFDDGAIHILTSASLSWLQVLLPRLAIDARRFRPNIVVDCEGSEPLEGTWLGRTLQVGTCELEIVSETKRCVMTTLAHNELPHEPEILRTLSQQTDLKFGVYATVLRQGALKYRDSVSFTK